MPPSNLFYRRSAFAGMLLSLALFFGRCYKEEVPALSEQQPEQFTWVSSTHSTRTVAYVVAYRGKLGRQKFRRPGELNAVQARIFESFTIAAE